MTYLFDTEALHPRELLKGDILYYADSHAVENELLHLLQVTKVVSVTSTSVILDNGRKFNLDSGEEVTRGSKGILYEYTNFTIAAVTDAQHKLTYLNDVEAIDFSSLTTQQLSMIRDVAKGAFTQVSVPSPCGGCSDTVEVAGLSFETQSNIEAVYGQQPEVTAPIAFNDASYELSDSELDDIEDVDEDDALEDRCASGHTV